MSHQALLRVSEPQTRGHERGTRVLCGPAGVRLGESTLWKEKVSLKLASITSPGRRVRVGKGALLPGEPCQPRPKRPLESLPHCPPQPAGFY